MEFRLSLVSIGVGLWGKCDLHTLPLVWTRMWGWGFWGVLPFPSLSFFFLNCVLGGLGVPGQGAGFLHVGLCCPFFVSWEYSFP